LDLQTIKWKLILILYDNYLLLLFIGILDIQGMKKRLRINGDGQNVFGFWFEFLQFIFLSIFGLKVDLVMDMPYWGG
jgi:hypothetical protein